MQTEYKPGDWIPDRLYRFYVCSHGTWVKTVDLRYETHFPPLESPDYVYIAA